eukprot:TRINITY_DN79352_c0_g1_i1.p1 TRINITY_DN79352_c0_g1~~TRINITY_DN79352_c0_g1_i1.p1  ORF type:complete len:246 (-),score=133.90 TRINITY_DN79352_c0_g1_i1:35-772(-)
MSTAKNQVVMITGASSGIGAATAQVFSDAGYPLLLVARRVEKMEALKLPNTLCIKADVTKLDTLQAAVKAAEDKFEAPVGVLVNNAGVMLLGDPADQDQKEIELMNNVNINGVLNAIKAVVPGMKARKSGHVINVSSIAGQKSFPNHAVYCGTKYAVRAITESLREEYVPHGVKVISICPGVVETELITHQTSKKQLDDYNEWKKTMDSGVLLPEDVAGAIFFAFNQPARCLIREITLSPTSQPA